MYNDSMEKPTTASTTVPTLVVADRCDRCPAQAWVIARFVGGDLMFCKHHFEKHELMIREQSYEIIDERERINQKPDSSA